MAFSSTAETPQRSENTRHAILDAAVSLYHAQGVAQTTASAIIAASGVGRATFYRHFADQDDVLNQALKRDFESMLDAFEAQRFDHRTLETQIIDDVAWFLRQLQAKPALSLIFGRQRDQFLPRINATLNEFRKAAQIYVLPIFERARKEGRIREGVTVETYVDWVAFVATSLQVVDAPFSQDDFKLRDALRHFLLPSLIRD
ncbi:MAG: TetR family transcriptional regulator [Gammaproteobacteria bacterium]|nr:TetR family transcriptional regulator [Gammaproteobacteria bacterium]MCY4198734.1 TetR family transcriptional regulator [Gammaproteobacteria bacterium]MCY4276891.1 TetR family transcriptional regulator [Gammaproteobacteria bacterium]MCY4323282.1 TetR family transcriptional regulator [Gammaproteobacteria bacterium]